LQRSTKCRNKNDAAQVESVWKSDLAKGEAGIYKPPTLSEFSAPFLNHLPTRVSKRTFRFYVDAWRPLVESPLGQIKLNQIDGLKLEAFTQERLKVVGVTTVNHSLRTLRRALHLAEQWKLIPRAPKISLLRGEMGREFVITEEILAKLLKLCDEQELSQVKPFPARRFHPEMKALLPFLIDTGLRAGEVCRLDWEDVSLKGRGSVFIRHGKSKYSRRHVPPHCPRQVNPNGFA
jgi:integrase